MNSGALIFDLDGTLVNSVPVCTEIINYMLDARGSQWRLTNENTRSYVSVGGHAMLRALLGEYYRDATDDVAEFRARYACMPTPADALFPEVRETLEWLLERNLRLSICSNKPQALCEKILRDLSLDSLFEVVVGGDRFPFAKPDPRHLGVVLRDLELGVNDAIYVGDSEIDHQLARNAGVEFVYVLHGYGNQSAIPEDIVRLDRFSSLKECVRTKWGQVQSLL